VNASVAVFPQGRLPQTRPTTAIGLWEDLGLHTHKCRYIYAHVHCVRVCACARACGSALGYLAEQYAASRKVTVSNPDEIVEFFQFT
jgi:hypothetical protein